MQVQTIPPVGAKWHMLAFNMTHSAAAGYEQMVGATDPVFTKAGSNFQNPYNLGVAAAFIQSTNILRARINTASLRLRGFPQIRPPNPAVVVPTNPNWMDMQDHPIYLRPDEDIEIDADPGANADVITAFLWVVFSGDMTPNINSNVNASDLRWIRATASVTTLLNAWSGPAAITLEDVIEGGSYDVYGAECFGVTAIGFRLWFQNQYFKPGTLGFATVGLRLPYPWYEQKMGLWGNFNTYSLPQLEIFASSAATNTYTLFLLIGKSSQQFRGMSQ